MAAFDFAKAAIADAVEQATAELREQVRALKVERDAFASAVRLADRTISEKCARVAALEAELAESQQAYRGACIVDEKHLAEAAERIRALENDRDEWVRASGDWSAKCAELQAEVRTLRNAGVNLDAECDRLKGANSVLVAECAKIVAEAQRYRSDLNACLVEIISHHGVDEVNAMMGRVLKARASSGASAPAGG